MDISTRDKVVGFETAGDLLKRSHPELVVSKRKHRQAEAVQLVCLNREGANPNLGFASRPFVLCGLPIKRPTKGVLMHERRNGQFVLQVIGRPNYGVAWEQDRLVPFSSPPSPCGSRNKRSRSAAPPKCWTCLACSRAGRKIDGWIASLQRVFGATIFFGTDTQKAKAAVTHQARFNLMCEARIWYSRDPNQALLAGRFENVIVLSDEFYREVTAHSIPTDLEAAKALSCAPAALGL